MIPQDTVQQILHAAEIGDVIGDFVSLTKKGANLTACCPFHNEKTPSFSVSPVKQIYKCFGCGKGGDSVRFIMDLEGLSYPDALRYLAKKYSIEIKERELSPEELAAVNVKESLFIITDYAKKYFVDTLENSEDGKAIGYSYFKERGFTHETIEKFGLGYSLDAWGAFTENAIKNGFSLELLEKAGLSITKEGKEPIDRFRGRVMFPIHNVSGGVIGFGARTLSNDKKQAKYLNSPETDIYSKSKILYGIYEAKNAIRQKEECYLVEGYTDVLALNQAGIENVVASSGTSLTIEQIQLIRRFSPNVTILFDGDQAGLKASFRGIDLILEEGLDVKAVSFPENEDPDSYLKKIGSNAFKDYLEDHKNDFIKFKTEVSLQEVGNDPLKKAGLIKNLVESIVKVPDSIKRSVYFSEVARLLSIDEQILVAEGNKILRKASGGTNTQIQPVKEVQEKAPELPVKKFAHEESLLKDLVLYGSEILEEDVTLADYLLEQLPDVNFGQELYSSIFSLYKEKHDKNEVVNSQFFTSFPDEEIQKTVVDWVVSKHTISENWINFEINVPTYLEHIDEFAYLKILRLKKEKYEQELQELLLEFKEVSEADEEAFLKKIDAVKQLIKKYAAELGSVF